MRLVTRFRVLPDRPEIGWTPYLWLVYLAFFFFDPLARRAGAGEWTATVLATVAFLPLYFLSFWVQGARQLAVIAGMATLGAVFLPFNAGASVFFIYAAGCCGFLGSRRAAVWSLVGLIAFLGIESWWLAVPPWGWMPGVVFSLVVGAANIHGSEVERTRRRLLLAEEEVARLARLAERERIGRDLHDLLGHTLSLITLKAELAARLAERDAAAAAREIRDVERISREALAEVRQAVRGYRSGGGLAVELAHARLALAAAEVELEEDVVPGRLPVEVDAALGLGLREAITNVVRHAGAQRCRIALRRDADEVALEVGDDGRGGLAPEGAGLAGMRERLAALGGRLERSGQRGTTLRLVLPLAASPNGLDAGCAPALAVEPAR
jgi:two-component system sensor histidine kinase DesK